MARSVLYCTVPVLLAGGPVLHTEAVEARPDHEVRAGVPVLAGGGLLPARARPLGHCGLLLDAAVVVQTRLAGPGVAQARVPATGDEYI